MADHVIHSPERSRYLLVRDTAEGPREIGKAVYALHDGVIEFTHTVIDPALEERGLGSTLIREALVDVRENREERIVATCPFVARYLEKHPEAALR